MIKTNFKLLAGQNLRYTGRSFPGFIKGLPYMVFVANHSVYQFLVTYNGRETVVEKYFTDLVS